MVQVIEYTQLPRRILEALKDGLGNYKEGDSSNTGFATYWDGDPIILAESHLPALIVDWETAVNIPSATGMDKWQDTIVIKLVLNKMQDAGVLDVQGGGDVKETPTKKRLERLIFARNKADGKYLTATVMGILRTQFTMQGGEISQEPTVQFGNSQRPGQTELLTTAEAHITVNAREVVRVDSRQ